ncbi:MAG: TlyA family RNA methyltransferase [Micrococcales bacterium]|nr:TlyA family RNA methyltransferase [Micrococcales bacterium]
MRRRLDAELVRRDLARSRAHALELVAAGAVTLDGHVASKPATQVDGAQALVVKTEQADLYASRGGDKLAGALQALGSSAPTIKDQVCLDAGASAGGFTDVLLRRGAALVHAVDVGYGQLAWQLRTNPKVLVKDRTNVRHLQPGDLKPQPQLVVADLSFISLTTVLPALSAVATPSAHLFTLVKPQFEVGKKALPAGGVVKDKAARAGAVWRVAQAASDLGLATLDLVESPLPGPSGNHEFFLHLAKSSQGLSATEIKATIMQVTGGDLP